MKKAWPSCRLNLGRLAVRFDLLPAVEYMHHWVSVRGVGRQVRWLDFWFDDATEYRVVAAVAWRLMFRVGWRKGSGDGQQDKTDR